MDLLRNYSLWCLKNHIQCLGLYLCCLYVRKALYLLLYYLSGPEWVEMLNWIREGTKNVHIGLGRLIFSLALYECLNLIERTYTHRARSSFILQLWPQNKSNSKWHTLKSDWQNTVWHIFNHFLGLVSLVAASFVDTNSRYQHFATVLFCFWGHT